MNKKIAATGAAAVLGTVAVVSSLRADRTFMLLEGDPLHADTPLGITPVDAIPLARIKEKTILPKAFMGENASDAVRITGEVWTVTLDDGRTLRLEPRAAMVFPEGTPLDEMRRAAWGDDYEKYFGNE